MATSDQLLAKRQLRELRSRKADLQEEKRELQNAGVRIPEINAEIDAINAQIDLIKLRDPDEGSAQALRVAALKGDK